MASGPWFYCVNPRMKFAGTGILAVCKPFMAMGTLIDWDGLTHGKPHPVVFLESARSINRASFQCGVYENARFGIETDMAIEALEYAV